MEISKETLALINAFKNPLIDLLSDIKKDVLFFFDDGVLEYVQCYKQKYEKTKTFLFRNEAVDFYDTFYPITIRNSKTKIDINNIEKIFSETNFISVIGNAGSGKSMLMKHLFLTSVKQVFQIPIVIELRNLNHYEGSFFNYIKETITNKKLAPSNKILGQILENGNFLFLLDGYDEIYSENKEKLSNAIEEFTDKYNKNLFILTSRPGANAESFPRFECCFVKPLSNIQIKEFTLKQLNKVDEGKLAEKIIEVIQKPENKEYNSYLSSPLLLSMFILTFNSYPELPKSKSKFYWNVYDTLCTKHDTFTKHGGYQHERVSSLQNEEISKILEWFSYISLFEGNYNFDSEYLNSKLKNIIDKLSLTCQIENLIHDLVVAISIIIIDGLEYKFPHKSLQEYFTAKLISSQSKEVKEKIYSGKMADLSKYTHGGNENLWNLCNELDTIAFNKYFILHNLKYFIKSIDETSIENLIYSFLKVTGFKQGFWKKDNSERIAFVSIEYYGRTIDSIIAYLEIGNYSSLSLSNYEISKQHNDLILSSKYAIAKRIDDKSETYYTLDYVNCWDETLFRFIDSIGLAKHIVDLIGKVHLKVESLGKEIKMKEENADDLLNL